MQIYSRFLLLIFVIFGLVACGGGSSDTSEPSVPPSTPTQPSSLQTAANPNGFLTVTGHADPGATVTARFADGSSATTVADDNGNFSITSSAPQQSYGNVVITSTNNSGRTAVSFIESSTVLKTLYQATGIQPGLSFEPSLGINTEAPQGGAVTAGNPMPFVDIFRTARPFAEFNKKNVQGSLVQANTVFDANGWPKQLDPDLGYAKTKLLQGALKGSIPDGQYSVIYDGSGLLEFSGTAVQSYRKIPGENKYTLTLKLSSFDENNEALASETNAINMNVKNISPGSYISNIRIIMPGGTCVDNATGQKNPFIRVDAQSDCPAGTSFKSYESMLTANRNNIVFNPDYLLFLRNFKVIRMMNLMEASLKRLCFSSTNCPTQVGTWGDRASLSDAVWGGNDAGTPPELHKGVPVEVIIALANTLQRDIWINIPHVASNDYVTQLAKALNAGLDSSIKVYLEYSNEVWNSGFAAYSYMTAKGQELNLGDVPAEYQNTNRDSDYFARLRYHSLRSAEIFALFEQEFSGSIVRVLGSFIGDKILTREKLKFLATNSPGSVDAVAIAPYFFGCPRKAICPSAGISLENATTVDEVFTAIDQTRDVDVKSLDGTLKAVEDQLTEIKSYNNISLVTYEGGQHLVTSVLGGIGEAEKARLRRLFNAANRDPRMKDRYLKLLNEWKTMANEGTTLFTLYTLPQAYYRFGNFGLKEHLNKPRAESPKFDGAMQFQEQVGSCWWAGCQ